MKHMHDFEWYIDWMFGAQVYIYHKVTPLSAPYIVVYMHDNDP